MSKTKATLLVAATLVCLLAFAAPAFAWTHGQFSATTDACAGCHVAHAAEMPKLLKVGPTQTNFCFLCHGDGGTSAPYDVKDGYTQATGSAVYASTAGGFVRQFVDADSDGVIDAGELKAVTSRHNVWGFVYGDESGPVSDTSDIYYWIPGGSNDFTGSGFVCSSCHDPHAGGGVPDANGIIDGANGINPRLLRRSITVQDAAYTDLYVSFKFATVGTFTYEGVASGVYRVIEYADGSTYWCGACHNKFQTDDPDRGDPDAPGEGHAVYYFNMWRHPMNVHVMPPPPPPDFNDSIATGTPPEIRPTGNQQIVTHVRQLGCLTCHRAHSSPAAKAGWAASWPRDEEDPAPGASGGTTSALLRMDNRGVCWNCHREAKYNCWQDTRVDCSLCHPGSHVFLTDEIECSLCHP